jgi:hypothetical protein
VSKVGKRNRRLVRARVRVDAPLEAVWATLTDYEGLADFIPGLAECRLLHQAQGFARLYQVLLLAACLLFLATHPFVRQLRISNPAQGRNSIDTTTKN